MGIRYLSSKLLEKLPQDMESEWRVSDSMYACGLEDWVGM